VVFASIDGIAIAPDRLKLAQDPLPRRQGETRESPRKDHGFVKRFRVAPCEDGLADGSGRRGKP